VDRQDTPTADAVRSSRALYGRTAWYPQRCHAVDLLDAAPEHVCVLPGRDSGDARAGFVFAGKLLLS